MDRKTEFFAEGTGVQLAPRSRFCACDACTHMLVCEQHEGRWLCNLCKPHPLVGTTIELESIVDAVGVIDAQDTETTEHRTR